MKKQKNTWLAIPILIILIGLFGLTNYSPSAERIFIKSAKELSSEARPDSLVTIDGVTYSSDEFPEFITYKKNGTDIGLSTVELRELNEKLEARINLLALE